MAYKIKTILICPAFSFPFRPFKGKYTYRFFWPALFYIFDQLTPAWFPFMIFSAELVFQNKPPAYI